MGVFQLVPLAVTLKIGLRDGPQLDVGCKFELHSVNPRSSVIVPLCMAY